mgnify:CR=1 FL=1
MFFSSPPWVSIVISSLLISLIGFSVRPIIAFTVCAATLFLTGTLNETELFSGYTNTALITLMLLLTCSLAIEKTIFIKYIANRLFTGSYHLSLSKLLLFTFISSSITNNTAIVSILKTCITQNKSLIPSKYLLPLSYASIIGGTLTLVGTSTTLVVSGLVEDHKLNPLGFFSTTPVSIFIVASCAIIIFVTAGKLLPENTVDKSIATTELSSENNSKDYLNNRKSAFVLISFIATLLLSALSIVPLVKGLMALLAIYFFSNILTLVEIRKRAPLELFFVVGSAITIAAAIFKSGLSNILVDLILIIIQDKSVFAAFIAIYFITLFLTEMITNTAAAALVFPISISIAEHYGANHSPFIMAIVFGASACFLSPFGYQTNLMVYSAGKYNLLNYIKFGLPVSLTYSATAIMVIPIIYPFY